MKSSLVALMGCLILGLANLGQISMALADEPRPKLAIGQKSELFEFKDIRYVPHSLNDFSEKPVFVIAFINTTCPVAQRYLPKLVDLDKKYRGQGVQFLALYVGANETIREIAEHAMDHELSFPIGYDTQWNAVKTLGVERTPEVVVLDREHKLRYRGRIDDQFRLTGDRPQAAKADLVNALDLVLQNKPVEIPETPVDGCKITIIEPKPLEGKPQVHFYENVLPILQKHCQECHHQGGDAPFALESYRDAATNGDMIAETVAEERMPPWHGSRKSVEIVNTRGLNDEEKTVLLDWVRSGMSKGDPAKSPPKRDLPPGPWKIGQPDLIISQPFAHTLPATGYIDYKYVVFPYVFLQDTWVQGVEILPDNAKAVHHCNLAFAQIGGQFSNDNFITGKVPGGDPMWLDEGIAFKIPKNSVLAVQIHYVSSGKPEQNRIRIGLKYPRVKIQKQLHIIQVNTTRFAIPPDAQAHPVTARHKLPFDAEGIGLVSHMHLRGKDMTFFLQKPDGVKEKLLVVPNYHFDWQQSYRWKPGTKQLPAGSILEVVAHYDNSSFNPFNPNPKAEVRNGDQTYQEMMFGFYFFTKADEHLDLEINPKTGRVKAQKE